MARFDVYLGRDGDLYLDVQADRLDQLNTRVVIPLIPPATGFEAARKLNPVFRVNGQELILATQYLAAIPVARLGSIQASLKAQSDSIADALDVLLFGF